MITFLWRVSDGQSTSVDALLVIQVERFSAPAYFIRDYHLDGLKWISRPIQLLDFGSDLAPDSAKKEPGHPRLVADGDLTPGETAEPEPAEG
jgi:hypothetical protein